MVQHGQRAMQDNIFTVLTIKIKKKDTAFTFLRRQLSANRTEGPEAVPRHMQMNSHAPVVAFRVWDLDECTELHRSVETSHDFCFRIAMFSGPRLARMCVSVCGRPVYTPCS